MGYGDVTNISGVAEDVGAMPVVRSGIHGGVAADAPPESTQCGTGGSGGGYPPHW